jgi:hypothetical protein
MSLDSYIVVPAFSLTPGKLSLYNKVYKRVDAGPGFKYSYNNHVTGSIVRQSHNMEISTNAYRTMRAKINWLYQLAESQNITSYSGVKIYNFKIGFYTFTLPSKQMHPTVFITKNIWNQFLTELRAHANFKNYVWRLEFQKNGNVHYHLVTDCYLDYFFILKKWNRILKLHGYIQAYQEKMQSLSLSDYTKNYAASKKNDFKAIALSYQKNVKEKWSCPNSVDCKSVYNGSNIGGYIAKYFSKKNNESVINNSFDTPDNIGNLRLWFCSRSLSKLKSISYFIEEFETDITQMVQDCVKVKKYVSEYCTQFFFNMKDLSKEVFCYIRDLYINYAKNLNYYECAL